MLIAVVSSVVVVFLLLTMRPLNPDCPGCGKPLPTLRKPTSLRQLLFGGWTCGECGCEVTGRGKARA